MEKIKLQDLKLGQRFLFKRTLSSLNLFAEATIVERAKEHVMLDYANTHTDWVNISKWDSEYEVAELLLSLPGQPVIQGLGKPIRPNPKVTFQPFVYQSPPLPSLRPNLSTVPDTYTIPDYPGSTC